MVDLGAYVFKDLNTRKIKPEESFTEAYIEELYESENIYTATKRLSVVLVTKYENTYLNKVTETQYHHLTMKQRNDLLEL